MENEKDKRCAVSAADQYGSHCGPGRAGAGIAAGRVPPAGASGPEGMAATKIAEALAIAPSSLSFHLKELAHANLVTASGRGVPSSMRPTMRA
jgi:DNA-binding transcriptional ArsR family regulator